VNPRHRQLRPEALARIVATYSSIQEESGACLLMSALGHKRTFAAHKGMSALPPKVDIAARWECPLSASSGHLKRKEVRDQLLRTVS
jgi:hypothetical protein